MASSLIIEAFAERPQLLQSVQALASGNAVVNQILEDVAKYVKELRDDAKTAAARLADSLGQPEAKRRKLNAEEDGLVVGNFKVKSAVPDEFLKATWSSPVIEVSFLVPQRRRYSLQVSPTRKHGIRALNSTTSVAEFGVPWDSIEHILRLPVPEKTTASHNFCVFPRDGDGLSADNTAGSSGFETLVWGASDSRKKGEEDKPTESDAIKQLLVAAGTNVIEPCEDEFVSVYKNPMRKTEKQYHVKAHKGSKEAINSISYTSVLQRTFNLNISAMPAGNNGDDSVETEFAMLDQGDFAAIDEYVKRHRLNDSSMAEARKAKKYNVNKDRTNDDGLEGDSELKKAELEADGIAPEDDEDEEDDENFDPGSEGESEGEGSSSEEEDGDGDVYGKVNDADGDLVQDELGSEAEQVDSDE